jgi:hypothetical protein
VADTHGWAIGAQADVWLGDAVYLALSPTADRAAINANVAALRCKPTDVGSTRGQCVSRGGVCRVNR